MLAAYITPLAPTLSLLFSALILLFIHKYPSRSLGLVLVACTGLGLMVTRLYATTHTFSSWHLADIDYSLSFQLTHLNFILLGLIWWLLLIAFLFPSPSDNTPAFPPQALWFILGAAASLVFVSANETTLAYTIFAFDLSAALYWFYRQQNYLALARLFLGIFTAFTISLNPIISPAIGLYLLGLTMWLRLLFYPIMELDHPLSEKNQADLTHFSYFSFTLAVNVYLSLTMLLHPLPVTLRWLIALTMLWQGVLVWLKPHTAYKAALIRLVFNQIALLLLIEPLATEMVIAYALGLIFSLAALWGTPRLTKPTFPQITLYLAATTATLTLLGLPFTLSWSVNVTVYQLLFQSITPQVGLALIVIIAQGLVLSSLLLYWQFVFQTEETPPAVPLTYWLANGLTWLPWLIPGIGILSLSTLLQFTLPLTDFSHNPPVFIAVGLTWLAAGGLGYYRPEILAYLRVSERGLTAWLTVRWFTDSLKQLENLSKLFLQIQVLLEGKHYFAWTFFIALVGFLAVLLP